MAKAIGQTIVPSTRPRVRPIPHQRPSRIQTESHSGRLHVAEQRPSIGTSGRFGLMLLLAALVASAGILCAPRPARANDGECADSIPAIYDRVPPAVSSIASVVIHPYQPNDRVSRTVGSGVILDASGLVLTNSHVVFGHEAITVILDDGTSVSGQLIGSDPVFDVAVLRIPPPSTGSLPVAVPGSSARLRVGEEVLAIGSPLGLDQTLTRGIVSAINRNLPDTAFSLMEPLIQTDAPINPGNSGGMPCSSAATSSPTSTTSRWTRQSASPRPCGACTSGTPCG